MNYTILRVFRRLAAFIVRLGYQFRVHGLENLPTKGPAVIVANHVSFIDSLLLSTAVPRPMRFVMSHQYFANRWLQPLFRAVRAIPICPSSHDPVMKERAFDTVAEALRAGELVCIFPEGRITKHGRMNEFQPGVERMVRETPVTVIPVGIRGQWGSRCSLRGPLGVRVKGRGRAAVSVCVGVPIASNVVTVARLESAVSALAEPIGDRNLTASRRASEVLPPLETNREELVPAAWSDHIPSWSRPSQAASTRGPGDSQCPRVGE
ncbi:MAG: 1-acyl-sn-glycerol-3-phosphate acyltransferase [Bradymonadia bacterium]|jgi:1-acyl-sn-glycerol-3-phosphate acyltransferase